MSKSENSDSPGQWFRITEACARFFFLALFAFPLYPYRVTNVILGMAMGFTLISFLFRPFPLRRMMLRNLFFIIPFLPYLAEWLLRGSNPAVHFEFEKKIFFFTAPLLLPLLLGRPAKPIYRKALLVFSAAVVILGLWGCIMLAASGTPFHAISYQNGAFLLRDGFSSYTGLHPTYYSLFAVAAFCFLLCRPAPAKRNIKIAAGISAIFLLFSILLLAARIAIPALIVCGLMLIWTRPGSRKRKTTTTLATCIGLLLMLLIIPSLRERMSEITTLRAVQSNDGNTIAQRMAIIHCSAKTIEQHPLTGAGSAGAIKSLCDCYRNLGWEAGQQAQYNPHNQFLSFATAYGIPGLLLFASCLLLILIHGWKIPEGKFFTVLIVLFFLTESILERQMGVYFFGLLGMLLMNADRAGTGECNSSEMAIGMGTGSDHGNQ